MQSIDRSRSATWPPITEHDLRRRIAGLGVGERLVVVGTGGNGIGTLISQAPERRRSALLLSCRDPIGAARILDRLLDDLADLALDRFPRWHWRGDLVEVGETPFRDPIVPDPWLKAAAKRARAGLRPRFRRMARALEFVRLLGVIDPVGVVLVWEVDPASPERAGPVIEALEWCTRHGASAVVALSVFPAATAPYDRILYGAVELVRTPVAAIERFLASVPGPHHASLVERRVSEALARDPGLKDLFVCNAPVPVGSWGARPRVDLLFAAHRVVVELDGPEHRSEPTFSNDRHRDYDLLTAGYLVLRLTNEQVAADIPLAIEKIRAVVRLRRPANQE